MRFHSKGRLLVGLSALVVGLMGCANSTGSNVPRGDDLDEVAKVAEELGEPVTGCSTGGAGAFASNTLTISSFTGTVVISAPGGVLKMNGQTCLDAGATGSALLTTGTGTNVVKKIVMNDGGADTKAVMLDLYAGNLTTVFGGTAGANGLEITFTPGSTGTFMVRGTNAVDKVNMGVSTDHFFDIGVGGTAPDGKADVRVVEADVVKFTLAAGADVFTPVLTGISNIFVSPAVALTMTAPTIPLTIYGGDGDDVITDGAGNDTIFAGAGADKIIASNIGNDTFYGGLGTDMIDYGTRSLAVTASLVPNTATITFADKPADGDTVTIGSRVYTFKTAFSATPTTTEVAIGTDATTSRALLTKAIMANGVGGTDYKCAADCVVDPAVSAANGVPVGDVVVTALASSGTAVGVSEAGTQTSWDVAALAQSASVATADTDQLFEFENITTGSGNDTITGNEAANLIYGGLGNDILYGGAGIDTIYGGKGDDNIYGGVGDTVDNLFGEDGNDIFWADPAADGVDVITAGAGTDTVTYELRTPAVSPIVTVAVTVGTAGAEENIKNDVEVLIGSDGDDTLAFTATMTGTLTIDGKNGINTITGSLAASNVLTGGTGVDTITGGNSADTIKAGADNDVIDAKGGGDYIEGGAGNDNITCGAGDDIAYGEAGTDTINGDDGADYISGGDDADTLNGGAGNDQITGGAANDTLNGGTGIDNLNGNAGTNHYVGGIMETGDVCLTGEGTTDVVDANTCEVL